MPSATSRPIEPVEIAAMSSAGRRAEPHDRALAEAALDLRQRGFQRLLLVHAASFGEVHYGRVHRWPLIPRLSDRGNRGFRSRLVHLGHHGGKTGTLQREFVVNPRLSTPAVNGGFNAGRRCGRGSRQSASVVRSRSARKASRARARRWRSAQRGVSTQAPPSSRKHSTSGCGVLEPADHGADASALAGVDREARSRRRRRAGWRPSRRGPSSCTTFCRWWRDSASSRASASVVRLRRRVARRGASAPAGRSR